MKIIMESKELKEVFKTVKKFVAKSGGVRPDLEGVHFKFEDNVCITLALDGYKAVEIRTACITDGDGEMKFIVPIIDVPKSEFVEITEDKTEVTFRFDNLTQQTVRKIVSDGNMHNWEKFIPKKEPIFKIGIDPKLLKEVCTAMDNQTGMIEIDFYSQTEPVIIKGANKMGLVMPKRLRGNQK